MTISISNVPTNLDQPDHDTHDERVLSLGSIVGHQLIKTGASNLEDAIKSFSQERSIAPQSASFAARHSLSQLMHFGDFAVSTDPEQRVHEIVFVPASPDVHQDTLEFSSLNAVLCREWGTLPPVQCEPDVHSLTLNRQVQETAVVPAMAMPALRSTFRTDTDRFRSG